MKRTCFIILAAFFLFTSCSVRNTKITKYNKDQILEDATYSQAITGEELMLLMDTFMASSFHRENIEGKTVGQLIEEQKQVLTRTNMPDKSVAEQSAENILKLTVVSPELSAALEVAPLKKYFRQVNVFSGNFDAGIVTMIELRNRSGKDVVNLKGLAIYKDLSGQVIASQMIGRFNKPVSIKAGEKERIYTINKYNENDPKDLAFKNTDLSNLKFEWRTLSMQFLEQASTVQTK